MTLDFIAKLLLGLAALMVHHKVKKEKGIDKKVFKEIRIEIGMGICAIILIIASYVLFLI